MTELLHLDPKLRRALRGTDVLLTVGDIVVAIAQILTDDAHTTPWQDRLQAYLDELMGQVELDVLNTEIAKHPPDPEAIGRFVRHLKNDVYRRYAKRLLGAAAFSRLEQAFKDDAAVVVGKWISEAHGIFHDN